MLRHVRPSRSAGFSLLELVLVLATVAVLAAVAAPRYASAVQNYRAHAAAARVAADLNLARALAMTAAESQRVVFRVQAEGYELEGHEADGRAYAVDLTLAPYRAHLHSVNFNGQPEVTYDGRGQPGAGGIVIVRVGQTYRHVVVSGVTGRASLP